MNNHESKKHIKFNKIYKLKKELYKLKQENLEIKKQLDNSLNKNYKELDEKYIALISQKAKDAEIFIKEKVQELEQKFIFEKEEYKKYFFLNHAEELINILCQLKFIVNSSPDDPIIKNYLIGFKMFIEQFNSFLKNRGIKEITIKVNDVFDPSIMQAVDVVKNNKNQKQALVSEVISHAYKLHDRIVKLALVNVNN